MQEVWLEQEEERGPLHSRGFCWNSTWDQRKLKQIDLGDKQMLDPLVGVRKYCDFA